MTISPSPSSGTPFRPRSDRSALVTGAGQGLGKALSIKLAQQGYRVYVLDLDAAAAERTAGAIGGEAIGCDVTDPQALSAAAARFDHLDVLVNNAGIFRRSTLTEAPVGDIADVLAVNLMGTLNCVRAFTPALKAHGGAVVNLSSVAALTSSPEFGIYPATKAAVESMTRQLALELGPFGIRVNAVGPGFIRTEGTDESYRDGGADRRAATVPLGRLGTPDDIADVILFLCGAQSSYVSGQVIYVDGGLSAGRPGG